MADSQEELQAEYEQFEQAEASLISGDEAAPPDRPGGTPSWIKWMVLVDLIVIAVVLLIVFAN